jgi:putative oxidoreductase
METMKLLIARSALLDDLALLALRLTSGGYLALHGLSKLRGGVANFATGLADKGFPLPSAMAWSATLAELLGGLLVAVGLVVRPAAASLTVTMLVAVLSTHAHQIKQLGTGGGVGFEYPSLLAVVMVFLAVSGPGKLSLDHRLFKS